MSILPTQAKDTKSSSSNQRNLSFFTSHGDTQPISPRLTPSDHYSRRLDHPGCESSVDEDTSESSEKVNKMRNDASLSYPQLERSAGRQHSPDCHDAEYVHPSTAMSISGANDQSDQTERCAPGGSLGCNSHASNKRSQMLNANHLLNFHYDPIVRSQSRMHPPLRRHRKVKPYNKDLFLQANYKFVVLDRGSKSPELMDPDQMLQWENIVCLKYSTTSLLQCPICLDQPLCPQITSCGHIFCFPCILQYLLMGEEEQKEDSYKRCPLCFVMVSSKDLYTIYIEKVRQYNVGDEIDFLLLDRAKESLTPIVRGCQERDDMDKCSFDGSFSKFSFTKDVELSVRKAISDLDCWLARAESGLVDEPEKLPYVSTALRQLKQRMKYWKEHFLCGSNASLAMNDDASSSVPPVGADPNFSSLREPSEVHQNMLFGLELNQQSSGDVPSGSSMLDDKIPAESVKIQPESNRHLDKESYHFYQAFDGQHIILHPLCMKCLLHHYGSYDMLPNRVSGKILQLETVSQTDATRRRYRYLSHFSLTTTYQLCEIDLSKILPSHSLLPFVDEIKKRDKQRKLLASKEKKEKIKAEVAAAADSVNAYFNYGRFSPADSPRFSLDDFEALGSPPAMSSSPPVEQRISFSSVTRLGYAAAHDSPALRNARDEQDANTSGSRQSGGPSFANVITAREKLGEDAPANQGIPKKGKKQNRVLLSTASGRRY